MIKGRNSQIAFSKTCACFKQTQNQKNTEKQISSKQYSRLSRNNKYKLSKISLKKKKIQHGSPQDPQHETSQLLKPKIINTSNVQENSFNAKSFISTTCKTAANTSRFSYRPSVTERKVYSFIPTHKMTPLLSNISINNTCDRSRNSYNQNSTNYQISYQPIISSASTYKDMKSTYHNEKDSKCSIMIESPLDKDNQLKRNICKSSNFGQTLTQQSIILKNAKSADKQKTILETKQLSTSYIFKPNINLSNSHSNENRNVLESTNCYNNIKTIQSQLNQSASQYSQLANSFYQNKINKNKITGLFNNQSNQFKVHSIL